MGHRVWQQHGKINFTGLQPKKDPLKTKGLGFRRVGTLGKEIQNLDIIFQGEPCSFVFFGGVVRNMCDSKRKKYVKKSQSGLLLDALDQLVILHIILGKKNFMGI